MSDSPPPMTDQHPPERLQIAIPNRKPIVTYVLIGVTIVFFIIQLIVQTITGYDILFIYLGKINEFIMDGQFWRLITPIVLHGSILHIALNMYALHSIGRNLEVFYGHGRFLLLYMLSGFAGYVLSFVLTKNSSLGASTALFGIFTAQGVFIYQNRKLFGQTRTRSALMNLLVVFGINLIYGFMPNTRIDNMGHIGGAIGGIFFAWKAGPLLKITGQAPFLQLEDGRKKQDVLIASLVVLIGFIVIALIPFITR